MQDFLKLYVIAMESEASSIISNFKKVNDCPEIYINDDEMVVITGIGKVNASFALTYVLSKYNVQNIFNLGFVGAFGEFKIGDKVIVEEAKYHDFDLTMFGYEKGQVPKMPTSYYYEKNLINNLGKSYKKTLLLTGDYFQTNPIENNFISDMEGTALFHVAYLFNKPIASIKVVSDVIGRENHLDEYKEFEAKGSTYILDIYNDLKE